MAFRWHFDIQLNPFYLLGVEPSASSEKIHEAYQQAAIEEIIPEEDLRNVKETLRKPNTRLQAELSSLLDTPEGEADSVISRLRSQGIDKETRRTALGLPPLSRVNLLTHIASKSCPDSELLIEFVRVLSEVDGEAIVSKIGSTRQAARFVAANEQAAKAALHSHLQSQARSIFSCCSDLGATADSVLSCTQKLLPEADHRQIEALTTLLNGYRRFVEPELSRLQGIAESSAHALSESPSDVRNLELLLNTTREWQVLAEPCLMFEAHKGRDDAGAREFFASLRSSSITIANKRDRHDVALTLTQAYSEIFRNLPRALEQITDDLRTLNEQVHVGALIAFGCSLDTVKLEVLAHDLKVSGFSEESQGKAGELFAILERSLSNAAIQVISLGACSGAYV